MKQRSCVISFPCKFFREKKKRRVLSLKTWDSAKLCVSCVHVYMALHSEWPSRITCLRCHIRCNSEIEPAKRLAWVLRTPCATAGANTVEQLNVVKGHNQSLAEFWFWRITDTVARKGSRISSAYESWLWQQNNDKQALAFWKEMDWDIGRQQSCVPALFILIIFLAFCFPYVFCKPHGFSIVLYI